MAVHKQRTKNARQRVKSIKQVGRRRGVDYCACGCKRELPEPAKPSLRRNFLQGHDAKLKSILKAKLRGERVSIPAIARKKAAAGEIAFASSTPYKEAFAA